MAFEHDRRYKQIFLQPYFLQKLIESFVDEPFVKKLDFSTLNRIDKSFINVDFMEKELEPKLITGRACFAEKSIIL